MRTKERELVPGASDPVRSPVTWLWVIGKVAICLYTIKTEVFQYFN
jgi:hypothetical protein